jgi:hypothetical protein
LQRKDDQPLKRSDHHLSEQRIPFKGRQLAGVRKDLVPYRLHIRPILGLKRLGRVTQVLEIGMVRDVRLYDVGFGNCRCQSRSFLTPSECVATK